MSVAASALRGGDVIRRHVLGRVEERVYLGTFTSRHVGLWRSVHGGLTAPLLGWGRLRVCTASAGDAVVRVACCGPVSRLTPLLWRMLPPLGPLGGRGRVPLWSPQRLSHVSCDVVAVAIHRWLAARFRRGGWATVPAAVRWRAKVRDFPPARPRHSLASDLRRLARRHYEHEMGGSESDWAEFTGRMLLPLARGRFGAKAAIPSHRQLRAFARAGRLLFVRRDGVRVAGVCAVPQGRTLWLPVMGVRDADPKLERELASAALHVAAFSWARQRGFDTLDFGRSSPFVSDGLHRFRRKWGLQPAPDPLAPLTALRVAPSGDAAARAFHRAPVLAETEGGLGRFPASS